MGRPTELLGVAELNELLEGRALEVMTDVASFDGMHNYAPELYFEAGRSALAGHEDSGGLTIPRSR